MAVELRPPSPFEGGKGGGLGVLAPRWGRGRNGRLSDIFGGGSPPSPTLPPSRGKGVYERSTYTPRAAAQAKRLRREMNASERKLWEALRKLKLNIRRQAPVGNYIADFVHLGSRLVVEVDGARHELPEAQLHDLERDEWLRSQGYRILRIRDQDAFSRPRDMGELIAAEIAKGRV
jgi:very-short-patch-repair endonuclease